MNLMSLSVYLAKFDAKCRSKNRLQHLTTSPHWPLSLGIGRHLGQNLKSQWLYPQFVAACCGQKDLQQLGIPWNMWCSQYSTCIYSKQAWSSKLQSQIKEEWRKRQREGNENKTQTGMDSDWDVATVTAWQHPMQSARIGSRVPLIQNDHAWVARTSPSFQIVVLRWLPSALGWCAFKPFWHHDYSILISECWPVREKKTCKWENKRQYRELLSCCQID